MMLVYYEDHRSKRLLERIVTTEVLHLKLLML